MLDRLRLAGVLTRADLSRGTGLTVQTAVRLIEGLHARGMVQMGEAVTRHGRGKPGVAVSLNPAHGHTLGISIATDALTLALVDFSGAVLACSEVGLTDTTLYGVLTQLQAADAALLARVDTAGARLGIGVALGGFFTGEDAFIHPPEPLRALGQIALCPWLAEAFGQPVWMDNDGSVAAAGEAMLGVGQRHRDFAYLSVGYGLGGGLVIDGQVMRGHVATPARSPTFCRRGSWNGPPWNCCANCWPKTAWRLPMYAACWRPTIRPGRRSSAGLPAAHRGSR